MTEADRPTGQDSTAAAAMRGDRHALESIWREHRRWVAAVILAYKPRSADLEDLLQEVAMTLVAKINTLRDESNVKAWLRVVAINAARAAGRSLKVQAQPGGDSIPSTAGAADEPAELNDHSRRIMGLASQLPEAYREPLLLKALHGMRTRQIAEILDIPEATVDTRISRARRMVREMIESGAQSGENKPSVLGRIAPDPVRSTRVPAIPAEVCHE